MHSAQDVTQRMRDRGLRVTPQRIGIISQLVGSTAHPTVESLHDAARAEMPSISLRTVYSTVHDLEAMGEVRLLDLGTGSVRVDPNVEEDHHHMVCTSCGMVRDVPVDLAGVVLPRRYRSGFALESVDVIFRGTCEKCSAPDAA